MCLCMCVGLPMHSQTDLQTHMWWHAKGKKSAFAYHALHRGRHLNRVVQLRLLHEMEAITL